MGNLSKRALSAATSVHSTLQTVKRFHTNPLADLSLLEQGLTSHSTKPDRHVQRALIKRIATAYHRAKHAQQGAPLAYQPGGEWKADIHTRRAEYLAALSDEDLSCLETLLENFFRNSGGAGLITYGYYGDIATGALLTQQWFVNCVLQDLATWKSVIDEPDVSRLAAPPIGNPWGYLVEGHLVTSVSCRHHYYASRVADLLADVTSPVVAEIGGGFGGFAYHLLSSRRSYTYLNFDLPEVLLIAQYYLLSAFPERRVLLFGERDEEEISRDVLDRYDIILMPNCLLPKLAAHSVDLVINTGSLSEMDYHTIEEYLSQIARICKVYLFHENSDREVSNGFGHVEVPSSKFPISRNIFQRMYKFPSLWGGSGGRYWEHLYQCVGEARTKLSGQGLQREKSR